MPFDQYIGRRRGRAKGSPQADRKLQPEAEELLQDRLRADRAQFADGFDPDTTAHTIMAIYTGIMVLAKDAPMRRAFVPRLIRP